MAKNDFKIGDIINYSPTEEVLSNHKRTDKQTFNNSNPAIVVSYDKLKGYVLNVFTVHGVVVIENYLKPELQPELQPE